MKTNTITTKHVYSDQKQNTVFMKKNNETWTPINFQWIPVVKLNNQLNQKTNTMKKVVILPFLLALTLILSCSKDSISGSGDLTSESRTVTNFTKVKSEGVFEVMITQGNDQSIQVIADDNIIHKVKTVVVDNELRIFLDDDDNYTNISVEVIITVPSINGIKNFGIGHILALDIDTNDNFNVYNSGLGGIKIEGSASGLNLENEGSGTYEGFLFNANDCNVRIIGSGDCEINCANNLDVHIEGSGDVYYMGTPLIEADISGSGNIVNAN